MRRWVAGRLGGVGGTYAVEKMLMEAAFNDCLRMHVRANAWVWICNGSRDECRTNIFSALWWICSGFLPKRNILWGHSSHLTVYLLVVCQPHSFVCLKVMRMVNLGGDTAWFVLAGFPQHSNTVSSHRKCVLMKIPNKMFIKCLFKKKRQTKKNFMLSGQLNVFRLVTSIRVVFTFSNHLIEKLCIWIYFVFAVFQNTCVFRCIELIETKLKVGILWK